MKNQIVHSLSTVEARVFSGVQNGAKVHEGKVKHVMSKCLVTKG